MALLKEYTLFSIQDHTKHKIYNLSMPTKTYLNAISFSSAIFFHCTVGRSEYQKPDKWEHPQTRIDFSKGKKLGIQMASKLASEKSEYYFLILNDFSVVII